MARQSPKHTRVFPMIRLLPLHNNIRNFLFKAQITKLHMSIWLHQNMATTLEPEILYLAYLALEVTSPAIVGLNAFLASPNLP